MTIELREDGPCRWRIDPRGNMRVPGVVFASEALLPGIEDDRSLEQVCNVATLPGIVEASFAMPDIHWGYGFPIGGVAATDVAAGGVVSPGGVGFDISCGVRLLVSKMTIEEFEPQRERIMDLLDEAIPRGVGKGAIWRTEKADLVEILHGGARYAINEGFGEPGDLDHSEDGGALEVGSLDGVSDRAIQRGLAQVGSLGSGNHFLEIQAVDDVLDRDTASAFGLRTGQVCVLIHTGSRGFGHQVCSDFTKEMESDMRRYGIDVPDRQLACVPVESEEGRRYLAAMAAAANFARVNRQLLTFETRKIFEEAIPGSHLELLYDVSHNMAKLEEHEVSGERRRLCVHRKGSTLALGPGHPDLPSDLSAHGQPVFVPGSMGTASMVLTGVAGTTAFDSTPHGAGRTMSRHQASDAVSPQGLREEMRERGIAVRGQSDKGLTEEAPLAYKDIDEVVRAAEQAGLAKRVARLVPLGVVKG